MNQPYSLDGEIDELYAGWNENIMIHTAVKAEDKTDKEEPGMDEKNEKNKTDGEKTIADVLETLNEEQKIAVYALIGEMENDDNDDNDDKNEGGESMKHNVFDQEENRQENVLTHSAMNEILEHRQF